MRGAMVPAMLALACAPTAMVNQASEEAAIRAVESQYMAAFNAHDPDRLVPLHTPDAVVMVSNSPLATGSTQIRGAFSEFFKAPNAQLSFAPTKIDVVTPSVATEVGTYTLSFDTPQGRMTDRGNYTTIWHKVNGEWRLAVDAPVSTTPMSMASAPAAGMDMGDIQLVSARSLSWNDFTPPGFAPGMKLAVISGDPGKAGPYTVRLQFPAGYRFPVHWHPGAENLTVVSGTFQLAMGNTANWNSLQNYSPGDYIYIPPRHAHFGGSASGGASVIQLHGQGPFQVMVGPAPM
jgi:uncharacterized protein (TIGR02246 family)